VSSFCTRHHTRQAILTTLFLGACAKGAPPNAAVVPAPRDSAATRVVRAVDTVKVRDPALEQQLNRLEMQLLGKEAQMEELQARLDDARREVVRTMAKLRTVATRAEAASAMAEAELAVQSLRSVRGSQGGPELTQGGDLLQQGTEAFNRQNFGGALYLATQAKEVAQAGKSRLSVGEASRTGEVMFAVPVPLVTTSRGNLREGPGTRYDVLQTLDSGSGLVGYSYVDDWVKVRDQNGRNGWVFSNIVSRRQDP
jgi:SH3 domain-containing protein